jgi:hypothetical protein
MAAIATAQPNHQLELTQWAKAFGYTLLMMGLFYLVFLNPAFAQTTSATGGTGAVTAVQARVTGVAQGFNTILQVVGVALLSAAFLYVGYGMAFGGKKWSDVANVFYGCTIAGIGSIAVTWLFGT